jgi:hypothetical protein
VARGFTLPGLQGTATAWVHVRYAESVSPSGDPISLRANRGHRAHPQVPQAWDSVVRQEFPNIAVRAVGTPPVQITVVDGWQISAAYIDNPSDSWLLVQGGNTSRMIQPRSIGNIVAITPTTTRINLSFVAAPVNASPSVATGGPISVTVTDDDIPDLAGMPYDLYPAIIDLTAEIVALIAAINNLQAGYGANRVLRYSRVLVGEGSSVVASAGTNERLHIVSLSVDLDVGEFSTGLVRGNYGHAFTIGAGASFWNPVLSEYQLGRDIAFQGGDALTGAFGEDLNVYRGTVFDFVQRASQIVAIYYLTNV